MLLHGHVHPGHRHQLLTRAVRKLELGLSHVLLMLHLLILLRHVMMMLRLLDRHMLLHLRRHVNLSRRPIIWLRLWLHLLLLLLLLPPSLLLLLTLPLICIDLRVSPLLRLMSLLTLNIFILDCVDGCNPQLKLRQDA